MNNDLSTLSLPLLAISSSTLDKANTVSNANLLLINPAFGFSGNNISGLVLFRFG
ncbi:hypothetical protein [Thiothrix unzii]|uniref:hypothetical protein n=1 Tax=Thiothrix unzii TaxID=111769 RepID=UPI002A371DCF|nr:hypothetical protein [Thiothrix unzii]MDX9989603.1 hypothetical protein [Thiothrix unzii]